MFRPPRTPIMSASMRQLSALFSLVAVLGGCSLPKNPNPIRTEALSESVVQSTRLHQVLQPLAAQHPDRSGIYPLDRAFEAFAVRALLAEQAQRSLDVQYYIWRADTTGLMLLQQLKKAADRGVRVRLLLDDNGTRNLDDLLSKLNAHPNIQVRLFNPFVIRQPKGIGFFFDFERLNRRMHNKSFTVDNTVTIVGGRNIGDEYFGAHGDLTFADLDILALGQVVPEVSNDFDRYWNNDYAFPLELLVEPAPSPDIDFGRLLSRWPARWEKYQQVIDEANTIQALLSANLPLQWVKTEIVSDDPDKARGLATPEDMLSYQLHHAIGTPEKTVDLISPYFVPTATGVLGFSALINEKKVRVRVLTNSYDATDVAIVHAGYMKQRKNLLRAGVELYELKKHNGNEQFLHELRRKRRNPLGISGSSLHAKTFAIDGKRLFVGSFNFDPRSALLNTELGFVIHSPQLAQQIANLFELEIPLSSYKLQLTADQRLRWVETMPQDNTPAIVHEVEPETNLFERMWLGFLSRLPIEWLL